MLVWGVTLLNPWLMARPILFVLYWVGCALFTGLALLNALLDMIIVRKRSRDEQHRLARRSFGDGEEQRKEPGA